MIVKLPTVKATARQADHMSSNPIIEPPASYAAHLSIVNRLGADDMTVQPLAEPDLQTMQGCLKRLTTCAQLLKRLYHSAILRVTYLNLPKWASEGGRRSSSYAAAILGSVSCALSSRQVATASPGRDDRTSGLIGGLV